MHLAEFDWNSSGDVILLLIAGAGLVLSLISLVWQWRTTRTGLLVSVGYVRPVQGSPTLVFDTLAADATRIVLQADNTGGRPIGLGSGYLQAPDGFVMMAKDTRPQLACTLDPGALCQGQMRIDHIQDALRNRGFSGTVELTPIFKGTIGKLHKGKPIRLQVTADPTSSTQTAEGNSDET